MSGGVEPLVQLRSVTVSFDGHVALDDVSLDLFPGEIHALMGQNGAGKSTLVQVLNGVIQPDRGSIVVDGCERGVSVPVGCVGGGCGHGVSGHSSGSHVDGGGERHVGA